MAPEGRLVHACVSLVLWYTSTDQSRRFDKFYYPYGFRISFESMSEYGRRYRDVLVNGWRDWASSAETDE